MNVQKYLEIKMTKEEILAIIKANRKIRRMCENRVKLDNNAIIEEINWYKYNYGDYNIIEFSNGLSLAVAYKPYMIERNHDVSGMNTAQSEKFIGKTKKFFKEAKTGYRMFQDGNITGERVNFEKFVEQCNIENIYKEYCIYTGKYRFNKKLIRNIEKHGI